MKLTEISLLAPARSLEAGIVAINHGADEIYIGAQKFGARHAAGNTLEDIATLIAYAHKFKVKVFVTINTLLFDREMDEIQILIHELHSIGTDAIIIQDLGILELDLPPIPIHASTQLNNIEVSHIQFLEKVGFSRAILGRELTLDQIKEIRNNTTIELESFIHGSLCVSYSGQCYLSHFVGNRSANRGECAQPCRLTYDLIDVDENILIHQKHLLSLKDLNLTTSIPQLIESGVTSLKIEGRLKDNEYIANVVGHYRKVIDNYLAQNPLYTRSSKGISNLHFTPDIDKTFNRQYSSYFINGRTENSIVAHDSPKSVGKKIGTITKTTSTYAEIETQETLRNGDGICYFAIDGTLYGAYINSVNKNQITISNEAKWEVGSEIFRNVDVDFIKNMHYEKTKRKIECRMQIDFSSNLFEIKAYLSEENLEAKIKIQNYELANNFERASLQFAEQLSKSGESIFEVTEVLIYSTNLPFIPISKMNEIRRELLNDLEEKLVSNYPKAIKILKKTNYPYPTTEIDYNGNISNELSKKFYQRHAAELKNWSPEKWGYRGNEALMTTKYCLKYSLGWCQKFQNPEKNLPRELNIMNQNNKFKLEFDCKRCVMMVKDSKKDE